MLEQHFAIRIIVLHVASGTFDITDCVIISYNGVNNVSNTKPLVDLTECINSYISVILRLLLY